jgi:hypothetical protein
MPEMTGGCLCGQLRYTANAEPVFTGVCHCKDCQKESGTAFNVVIAVPLSAVSIQGSPRTYTTKGDSGKDYVRRLCPNCGSTILSEPQALPGIAALRAGTLDDTSWLNPDMEIYCDSAQPWVQLGGGMQRFPKMPPIPG